MKIDNILFDLDGTLVDSFPGIDYSARAAVAAVMPQRELPDLRSLIGPPIREILRRAVDDIESEALDALEREFRVSYDDQGWQKAVAYHSVTEVLSQLSRAKLKIFVVTNKPIIPAQRILERLALSNYFEEVVSLNSQVPSFSSKVEAAAYLVKKHGLDASATLFVGDSIDDARAAHLCGLRFAAVTYGYGRPDSQLDLPIHATLKNMGDLPSIIKGIHVLE